MDSIFISGKIVIERVQCLSVSFALSAFVTKLNGRIFAASETFHTSSDDVPLFPDIITVKRAACFDDGRCMLWGLLARAKGLLCKIDEKRRFPRKLETAVKNTESSTSKCAGRPVRRRAHAPRMRRAIIRYE